MSIETRLVDLQSPPAITTTGTKPNIGQAAHEAGLRVVHAPPSGEVLSAQVFLNISNLWGGKPAAQKDHLITIKKAMADPVGDEEKEAIKPDKWMHYLSAEVGQLHGNKALAIEMIAASLLKNIDIASPNPQATRESRTDTLVNLLRSTHTMHAPNTQMDVVDLTHMMLNRKIIPPTRYGEVFTALALTLPAMEQNLLNKTFKAENNPLHKGYQLLRNAFGTGPLLHERKSSTPRDNATHLSSAARLQIMEAVLPKIGQQSEARRPPSRSHGASLWSRRVGMTSSAGGLLGSIGLVAAAGVTSYIVAPAAVAAGVVGGAVGYYAGMRGGVKDSLLNLLLGQLDTKRTEEPRIGDGPNDDMDDGYIRPPSGDRLSPRLSTADQVPGWTAMVGALGQMNRKQQDKVLAQFQTEMSKGILFARESNREIVHEASTQVVSMAVALAGQHAQVEGNANRRIVQQVLIRISNRLPPDVDPQVRGTIATALTALA